MFLGKNQLLCNVSVPTEYIAFFYGSELKRPEEIKCILEAVLKHNFNQNSLDCCPEARTFKNNNSLRLARISSEMNDDLVSNRLRVVCNYRYVYVFQRASREVMQHTRAQTLLPLPDELNGSSHPSKQAGWEWVVILAAVLGGKRGYICLLTPRALSVP